MCPPGPGQLGNGSFQQIKDVLSPIIQLGMTVVETTAGAHPSITFIHHVGAAATDEWGAAGLGMGEKGIKQDCFAKKKKCDFTPVLLG